jgi:hypothetical protein
MPAAVSRSSREVQPGISSVLADVTFGSATLNCVVSAPLSDSLGTWTVRIASPPRAVLLASTSTWAEAVAVPAKRAVAVSAARISARGTALRDEGHVIVAFCCR